MRLGGGIRADDTAARDGKERHCAALGDVSVNATTATHP
jgi:hypothetical protein